MNPTQDTLDLIKAAYSDDISKSITTATGLVAYDLQAPAKNLYPVFTPLRNRIPRVAGGKGVATNWKVVQTIVGSGHDNSGWIPEGQRSGTMSYTTAPKAANYTTFGEEDNVTFEAVNAGKTFEDVRASMAMRLLQKLMLKEENAIIGGNSSLPLGIAATPTVAATGSGFTLPTATYQVYVVGLTQEGYFNSSVANGVAIAKTVTGADGATYTINGGSSNKNAGAASQAITLGQKLTMTATPINGAVAYAWFVGTAGNERLQAITTTNYYEQTTALAFTTSQLASAITIDASYNTGLAFDGLLTAALNPANSCYVQKLAANTTLTASGRGSVVEIDVGLRSMYDQFQLSPTVIYMNSQEINNVTQKCMTSAAGSLLRFSTDGTKMNEPMGIIAGGVVASYFNPFMPNGGAVIPVKIHPKVPPSTIILFCEDLPVYYQNNEVSNVAEMKMRQDYYQIDWPLRTRKYESGVYAEGVLAIYAPFALGVITNITNG